MNSLPFLFAQVANLIVLDGGHIARRTRSVQMKKAPNRLEIAIPSAASAGMLTIVLFNQTEPLHVEIQCEEGSNRDANLFWYVPEGLVAKNTLDVRLQKNASFRLNAVFLDESVKTDNAVTMTLAENANFDFALSCVGGNASTTIERVNLDGENAVFTGHSLVVAHRQNAIVLDQRFEHKQPFTTSEVVNYAVANDQGKIRQEVVGKIHKGNHGSVCRQQNRGVILKEGGSIQVDPYLLIDEFDVEAGHGAAVGQIDPEELYYLQSRGLDEAMAKRLIITGYVKPLLDRFTYLPYAYYMEKQIEAIIKGDSNDGEPL